MLSYLTYAIRYLIYLIRLGFWHLSTRLHLSSSKPRSRTRRILFLSSAFIIPTLLTLMAYQLFGPKSAEAQWCCGNLQFLYRKEITINNSEVAGSTDHINFPIMVELSADTDLRDNVQSTGYDILFADSNHNPLDHEIEKYDSATGDLVAWVRIPVLSPSSDTTIYMYYGNSTATNQQNMTGVWDDNFVLVHHLQETTTGATDFKDSTINAHNSSYVSLGGAGSDADADGIADGAVQFDGSNDNIYIADHDNLTPSGDMTLEIWLNFDSLPSTLGRTVDAVGKWHSGSPYSAYYIDFTNSGTYQDKPRFFWRNQDNSASGTSEYTGSAFSTGTWYHIAGRRTGTTNTILVNGDNTANNRTVAGTATYNSTQEFRIGGLDTTYYLVDGFMDEIRLSKTSRSNDWLTTTYNTISDNASFITVGDHEIGPGPRGYWKFDEGTDDTCPDGTSDACDASGHNFNLTKTNATWQTEDLCVFGKCLYFDGSGDFLSRADGPEFNFSATNNFTITGWFRHAPTSSARTIIAKHTTSGSSGGYKIYMDSSGDIVCGIDDDDTWSPDASVSTSTSNYDDNTWHHVACAKDSDSDLHLYLDGRLVDSADISAVGSLANTDTLYLGIDGDGSSNPWAGYLDEFKIFPQALSSNDIKVDYNSGAAAISTKNHPLTSDGLVGYWKLDESSGNVADSSGNGYTLTNNNSTTFVAGKFSRGSEHVPASSRYFSTASTIPSVQSVSFWVNPDSNTNYYLSLSSSAYLTSTSGTLSATGFGTNAKIYVNGTQSTTVTADTWQHITVTTNTAISADAFYIGRQDANYFDGTLDEVRLYSTTLSPQQVQDLYNWAPGPVGYWKFDEGSGSVLRDVSGNQNHGTIYGTPPYVPGRFGSALKLNGSSQYAAVTDPASGILDFSIIDFTITAWINTSASAVQIITIKKYTDGGHFFRLSTDGRLVAVISDGSNELPDPTYISTTALNDGKWHHVAAVFNRSGSVTGYVDGVKELSTSITSIGDLNTTDDLYIGRNRTSATFFNGMLDEIKIYNYALTENQLIQDMNAGHPLGGSPIGSPVIHHKFDEGADNTCSGGSNDVCNSGNAGATFDGTSTATRYASGKIGKSLDFDGSDDVVTLTNANAIDLNTGLVSGFTTSTWIYADSDGEGDAGQIWSKGSSTYLRVSGQSGSNLNLEASLDLATTDATVSVTAPITTGAWHHVALTYNSSTAQISLYVNGILRGTSTNGVGAPAADTADLLIGNNSAGSATFEGRIDEFKLYNATLTPAQILIDYNHGTSMGLSLGVSDADTLTDGAGNPPYGHWPLNENTGQYINDISGNNFQGTLGSTSSVESTEDPLWLPGKIGSSLFFDGVSNRAKIPIAASVKNMSQFTIQTWFKATSFPSSGNYDALYYEDVNNSAGSTRAALTINNNDDGCGANVIAFSFRTGDSTSTKYTVCGTTTLSTDTWYHATAVFNSDTDVHKVYLNSVEDGTLSQAVGAIANTDPYSLIFVGRVDSSDPFAGYLDDIKLYNYARTQAQITQDFNRGAPIAHYKFDECSGTVAYDSGPFANHGAINPGSTGNTSAGTCSSGTATEMWNNGTTGKYNSALDFDGEDDSVDVATFTGFPTSQISISAWIKLNTHQDWNRILHHDWGVGNGGYLFFTDASGYLILGIYSSGQYTAYSTGLQTGTWHHVVGTYDGTTVKTYLDGKLSPNTTSVSQALDTDGGIDIGGGTSNDEFDGLIDDVRIYNYALSASQVKSVMNNQPIRFGP